MEKFKIRASAAGMLMTDPKKKTDLKEKLNACDDFSGRFGDADATTHVAYT